MQALILADDGLEVTADNITAICKAANVEVEAYWPALFAKLFAKRSVESLLSNVGSAPAGGAAPAAAAAPAAGAAPAAAAPAAKKEEKPESDEDMGFSLFD